MRSFFAIFERKLRTTVYVLKHRGIIEKLFLFSVFTFLILGFVNIKTVNSLLISRLFIIGLTIVLIAGGILLSFFKEQIGFEVTGRSFRFYLKDQVQEIQLSDIQSYTVSYPGGNISKLVFRLAHSKRVSFYLLRKRQADTATIEHIVSAIHKKINIYNFDKSEDQIARKYSFLASNAGLVFLAAASLITFAILLLLLKKPALSFTALPLLLSSVILGFYQRWRERKEVETT